MRRSKYTQSSYFFSQFIHAESFHIQYKQDRMLVRQCFSGKNNKTIKWKCTNQDVILHNKTCGIKLKTNPCDRLAETHGNHRNIYSLYIYGLWTVAMTTGDFHGSRGLRLTETVHVHYTIDPWTLALAEPEVLYRDERSVRCLTTGGWTEWSWGGGGCAATAKGAPLGSAPGGMKARELWLAEEPRGCPVAAVGTIGSWFALLNPWTPGGSGTLSQ